MLARYHIVRGKRPPGEPLPEGHRIDVRKHTKHVLAPEPRAVEAFLEDPSAGGYRRFAAEYRKLLAARYKSRRGEFDALAADAVDEAVYIGCNCPTAKNPIEHCHTVLALQFMKKKYPKVRVVMPSLRRASEMRAR
jgi:hypothetical protein